MALGARPPADQGGDAAPIPRADGGRPRIPTTVLVLLALGSDPPGRGPGLLSGFVAIAP